MRSVQNSFLKKFLPHLVKEPREASKSVRCERVPEPAGTGHGLFHAAPNLLIKAFVPEHSVAVWSSSRMNSTSTVAWGFSISLIFAEIMVGRWQPGNHLAAVAPPLELAS